MQWGTQVAIAEQITEKGGKYLLSLKSNQKYSLQEVEDYFCPLYKKHIQKTETTELFYGRIETKCYEVISSPLTLENNEILSRWVNLQSFVKVTRTREDKKTKEMSQEVSISSEQEISRLQSTIRGHWRIENNLYHCLDVYFLQDASHKVARNSLQIMDIIMKINLLIIIKLKEKMKNSIPRMQKMLCRMNPEQIMQLKF